MDDYLDYRRYGVTSPDRTRTLFLDALNVFLSFLRIFAGGNDRVPTAPAGVIEPGTDDVQMVTARRVIGRPSL